MAWGSGEDRLLRLLRAVEAAGAAVTPLAEAALVARKSPSKEVRAFRADAEGGEWTIIDASSGDTLGIRVELPEANMPAHPQLRIANSSGDILGPFLPSAPEALFGIIALVFTIPWDKITRLELGGSIQLCTRQDTGLA